METYDIKVTETDIMQIDEVNICNQDEVDKIDKDILAESISNNDLECEGDIKAFCNGCDLVNPYYTSHTAKEEFESFMLLSKAEKEDEYTINLHGELI